MLLIPFVGRWPWTLSDFITAGVLMFGTGLTYLLLSTRIRERKNRIILGVALVFVFLLVWAELAVGIFS
jgi:hypothetical protein